MPYIKDKRRREQLVGSGILAIPKNAGELNYKITMVCKQYLEDKGESYQTYNDILGVLAAVPLELYRRKIAPYEDKKIKENGDVY